MLVQKGRFLIENDRKFIDDRNQKIVTVQVQFSKEGMTD